MQGQHTETLPYTFWLHYIANVINLKAVRAAEDREGWRELVNRSSVVPQRPSRVMG